jgi:hypothetical protein
MRRFTLTPCPAPAHDGPPPRVLEAWGLTLCSKPSHGGNDGVRLGVLPGLPPPGEGAGLSLSADAGSGGGGDADAGEQRTGTPNIAPLPPQ